MCLFLNVDFKKEGKKIQFTLVHTKASLHESLIDIAKPCREKEIDLKRNKYWQEFKMRCKEGVGIFHLPLNDAWTKKGITSSNLNDPGSQDCYPIA